MSTRANDSTSSKYHPIYWLNKWADSVIEGHRMETMKCEEFCREKLSKIAKAASECTQGSQILQPGQNMKNCMQNCRDFKKFADFDRKQL